jgi:WhiB family redox-sensing transcriptional regulator
MNQLLPPITEERPWVVFAACRDADPEVFFAEEYESEAVARCAECPVRSDCLAYALEARETYGVWGGYTSRQRRGLRRTA